MIWPFIWIPGGLAVTLGLAAVTVGLDPAEFAVDFLTDSAAALTPLAIKCALMWAIYTAVYILVTWAHRPSFNSLSSFEQLHFAPSRLFNQLGVFSVWGFTSAVDYCRTLLRRRSFWFGLALSWSPGVHPQRK